MVMQRRLFFLMAVVLTFCSFGAQAQSLDEAIKKVDSEQYQQAIQDLNKLISADDKNPEYYYWKGKAQFESGAVEQAKNTFEQGIKAKGKYPFNHVGMGRVLISENNIEAANEVLERALDYNKKKYFDVRVIFAVADAYLEAGQVKDAEVLLYQAQQDYPDNPRSYIALGNLYMAKKTAKLALNQYENAIQKDPSYVPAYTHIGQMKIDRQEYDEGAEYLQKAIELDPAFAPSYKYMGELWFRAGRYEQARDNYKKYVELTQNDLRARLRYADFLFLSENYTDAISVLEEAAVDTTTSLMLRLLGMAHHKEGNLDKAQDYLDKYFDRIDPEYTIFADYEVYGRILLERGDVEQADAYFAKAVDKDYERVTLYEDLAKEFNTMAKAARKSDDTDEDAADEGDWDDATSKDLFAMEAHYRQLYLDNKPLKELRDYYFLGTSNYYAGQYDDAMTNFNEVTKLADTYVMGHIWAFRTAGKMDERAREQDSTAVSWIAKDPAQRIIDLLGDKDASGLKKTERSALLAAYQILAFYKFDPEGSGAYDCDASQFFIEEIHKIDPDYPYVKPIVDYCEAVEAQGASGNN